MAAMRNRHHHEGISRRYCILDRTQATCLKACHSLRGSLHCILSTTVFVGERSAAQVTEQPRAQRKRAASAATRDWPQSAACSAPPGEHAPRVRRACTQSANASTTRAHQARARATQGEDALEGRTLKRTQLRLTRMRQLCAIAVWALHMRLWHRLEHAARRLALRWVPALAEMPAIAQRDQLNQLYQARMACATPCCRRRRLGASWEATGIASASNHRVCSVPHERLRRSSDLAPGDIECHGWVSFNILRLLFGGKCAIVVVDGDASLHKALLTFG